MEKINKYQKGKIYKIVDSGYKKVYYGSTINNLSVRMAQHRDKYKKYQNGTYHKLTVYNIFDIYGIENCKIELVEIFPCNCREELEAREGYYIKNNECVNKIVAGRSLKEYRESNKDRIKEYQKLYREEKKEHYKEYKKQWYLKKKLEKQNNI